MSNRTIKAELEIQGKDSTDKAFKSVALRMGQMERQMARMNTVAKRVNMTAAQFNRRIDAVNKQNVAMQRMAGSTILAGEALARYFGPAVIGAAVVGGLKKATTEAANFEESLYNIQKKSGATKDQMAKLGGEIRDLATQMPVSMEEIAAAFERGAASGVPVDELREFARLSAGVADAWDMTAENVGNAFAGFNVGLGIARKDLQAFASLINDLADSGIADESGIVDFLNRAGASLKNFGMTPEQISAYGAALLNLRIPSETAARAMDSLTGKLLAPENLSPKSRTALAAIVGDFGKFSKLAGDQKLAKFLDAAGRLSSQRRASLLGAFVGDEFDDEVMRMVAGSAEFERNLALAKRHMSNPSNSIAEAQAKKLELFNSQLKIMQGHFRDIAVDVGENLLPALSKAAEHINKTLSDGKAWSKGQAGQSQAEKNQELRWFLAQYAEMNKDDPFAYGKGLTAYDDAIMQVGRGEIKDVYDYIARMRSIDRYINQKVAPSKGGVRPTEKGGVYRKPTSMYGPAEFPGGDRHLDPYNLPMDGVPIPGDRNAMTSEQIRQLRIEGQMYGRGSFLDGGRNMTREGRRMLLQGADPATIGMQGMGGVLIEESRQAGQEMENSGKAAAEALLKASSAFQSVFAYVSQVAQQLERAAQAAKASGSALNGAGSRPGVDRNLGSTVPPLTP